MSGTLTEAAGGSLDVFGTVIIQPGGTLEDFSTVTVEPGGLILVAGTLSVYASGSLDIFGTVIVEKGASYSFLGTITVEPGGILQLPKAPTAVALSATPSTPLAGVDPVTITATVLVGSAGSGTPTGTVAFFDTTTAKDLGTATLVNGVAALNAGILTAGVHSITATYNGDDNFLPSGGTAAVNVLAPARLSGLVFEDFNGDGEVDFGEAGIPGVSLTLTGTDDSGHAFSRSLQTEGAGAYLFADLRPGRYTITETQPAGYTQGVNTVGTAGGTTASDHFFLDLAAGANGLNYNFGERPAATGPVKKGQAAGIGFWNNKNGQALILGLNGGTGTRLGDWLAATLPNIFGRNAAGNDLAGKDNAYIAAFFQAEFSHKGPKLDAQVLATALSVYATNATLDSTGVAARYGFTVSGDGLGAATWNVGSNGEAFGVAANTSLTVIDLLRTTDAQAVTGLLYNGNATRRNKANNVYSALNDAGGIG